MLERVVHPGGLVGYRSPRLAAAGVPHLFTTRVGHGGAELCLAAPDDASSAALRALAGAPAGASVVHLRQVHGNRVVADDGDAVGPETEGDAVVTARAGRLAMVYTADCVPILVATLDGRRVAAIHAGWRGLVAGVVPAAVAALKAPSGADAATGASAATGAFAATGAIAAIGPCLSAERCEMGPEVVERFVAAGLGAAVRRPGAGEPTLAAGRALVDVRAAALLQLEAAGIRAVDVSDRCTWATPELYSHRRDVTHGSRTRAGRLGALVGPRS